MNGFFIPGMRMVSLPDTVPASDDPTLVRLSPAQTAGIIVPFSVETMTEAG